MADEESRARAQLHQAREVRQDRALDFWQRTIDAGRMQRESGERLTERERQTETPRQTRL